MRRLILFAAAATSLASCSTTLYVPNTVNAPLLKEKGEVKIVVNSTEIQGAVAVTNHIGVMANGYYRDYKNGDYEHSGGLGEVGIGLFRSMAEDPFILECFAGAGLGNVNKSEVLMEGSSSRTRSFEAHGERFFLQPEVGYSGKVFDIALSPRFTLLKYNSFNSNNYTAAELAEDYLENGYLTNRMFAFSEPAVTVRMGWKWIKLQGQYGMAINIGGGQLRYPKNFSSLALVIDIAKWYRG
ncbi:MAG: hypothetical protein ACJ77K_04615 [Bacteroidia bacterium]